MGDIEDVRLLYAKGAAFVLCGTLAAGLLLAEYPSLYVAFLLILAIWCFARAYYFVFYVVQNYADPTYRYAGLWSFAYYLLGGKMQEESGVQVAPQANHQEHA